MVWLAGLKIRSSEYPNGDIEIVKTGISPGEKMYEELFYDDSTASRTQHPKILRATNTPLSCLGDALATLRAAVSTRDEQTARRILFDIVAKSEKP